jgi:hypothetical protein
LLVVARSTVPLGMRTQAPGQKHVYTHIHACAQREAAEIRHFGDTRRVPV